MIEDLGRDDCRDTDLDPLALIPGLSRSIVRPVVVMPADIGFACQDVRNEPLAESVALAISVAVPVEVIGNPFDAHRAIAVAMEVEVEDPAYDRGFSLIVW
jgi:hypothetical protein